ncbi:hypothetical protein N0V88_005505 [Collariella sp. IMI 366227]|nr:hypothetical protein N0V88_005505 [Collariella sp. IMI 366227]
MVGVTMHLGPNPSILPPLLPFDLDLPTIAHHAVRLARAGVVGLVTNGSNGEAVHLSRSERAAVTRATRTALDDAGFAHVPVMSGASEQSVRGTLELIKDAKEAGASAALVLCASFYGWAMKDGKAVEGSLGGKWEEAREVQQMLARADWAMTKRAIPGFKSVLRKWHEYGGLPRLPVLPLERDEEERLFREVEEMMKVEETLEDFGMAGQS